MIQSAWWKDATEELTYFSLILSNHTIIISVIKAFVSKHSLKQMVMDSEGIIFQRVSEVGSLIEATQSQAFWDST
jgi:hypothetical protein